MIENKEQFKIYLSKIGSGEKTSTGLTRKESAHALKLILKGKASPAQIGAFMLAHRIRRPEPKELAGMLDTYRELGPLIQSKEGKRRPICFGMPFDGRTRTSPIYPLTTLILLHAGQPVVLHGGNRMPVKYGITTAELFKTLGLDLTGLTIDQLNSCFDSTGLALVHQPDHFFLADNLITYRDELGKRPPIASMELIWTAHQGKHLFITGFVHPPTEDRAWKTLELFGEKEIISIKGLEGGTDLPISRACITARIKHHQCERIILHPREHKCFGKDLEWRNLDEWRDHALLALENKGPLRHALLWNTGVYLWFAELAKTLEEGLNKAEEFMSTKSAKKTLEKIILWRSNN